MLRREFDLSLLYDEIRKRIGRYTLSFDIKGLTKINEISTEAGDIAIRECLKRIDDAADNSMLLFRVGGDEFALLTNETDAGAAREIAMRIIGKNGESISWGDVLIPLSMRCGGAILHADTLKYDMLFAQLMEKIDGCRDSGTDIVII